MIDGKDFGVTNAAGPVADLSHGPRPNKTDFVKNFALISLLTKAAPDDKNSIEEAR
jgi:hypothetical protein